MVRNICFYNTSEILLVSKGVSNNVINEYCVVTLVGFLTIGTKLCWNIKFTKFLTFALDW